MMAWQLFVPLVVLLSSHGTTAIKDVECAYRDETFCEYMILAYKEAKHVENTLKGHRKFKEDEHRVSNLKLEILKILAIEDRVELLQPLKRALGSAANALFQLKVSCSGKPEEPVCEHGLQGLFRVTYDLVVAAMQVAQGTQLMTIHDALTFFDDTRGRKNMTLIETVEKAYALGTTVEEAI